MSEENSKYDDDDDEKHDDDNKHKHGWGPEYDDDYDWHNDPWNPLNWSSNSGPPYCNNGD